MKKLIALLLAMVMLLSILAGCGNTAAPAETNAPAANNNGEAAETPTEPEAPVVEDPDDGEPYEVRIMYRIAPQNEEATQAVLDHINNDILPDLLPNTTIAFDFVPASEYIQNYKLKCAAQEKMDLCLSMASYGFADFAAQGSFLPWNEYLQYMPNTMALIPEGWLEGTTINGEIYGIPNYQITARSNSVSLDNAMIEKYNVDITKIKNFEDLEEYYLKPLYEGGEYTNGSIVEPSAAALWFNSQADSFDFLGLEQIQDFLVVDTSDPKTVKNMFETEAVQNNYATIRAWADKGYFAPDNVQGMDYTTLYQENRIGLRFDGWQPYWEEHIQNTWKRDMTTIQWTEPVVTTASVRSTMTVLAYTSENPYRAAKVLDLINSNEELFNAICYGIEGVNYTVNEDGTINQLPESGYQIATWSYQIGNTMQQYLMPGKQADYNTIVDEMNRSAKLGTIFGFAFDATNVATEIASCKAVIDTYKEGFIWAKYEDVQATLDKMVQEMYDAGLQKILDEAQAQLDAWWAAK